MAITVIDAPFAFSLVKNIKPIVLETDTDPGDGLQRVDLIITIYDRATATIATVELSEYADSDGRFTFPISELIDEAIGAIWDAPSITNGLITQATLTPYSFKALATEYSGNDVTGWEAYINEELDPSLTAWIVVPGGVNRKNIIYGDYFSYFVAGAPLYPFLRWKSLTPVTDIYALNTFYYFRHEDVTGLDLEVRVRCLIDDFEVVGETVVGTLTSAAPDAIYVIQASWTNLTIPDLLAPLHLTGNVNKVEMWITDEDGNPLSLTVTFTIDYNHYKNIAYIVYQNSIGGFDDCRFTGERKEKGNYERTRSVHIDETLTNYVPSGYTKTSRVTEQWVKQVNTGELSIGQINNLRQMLLAPRLFEHDMETNKLWEIELTEKTKELIATERFDQNFILEYQYTWLDESYTPPNAIEI